MRKTAILAAFLMFLAGRVFAQGVPVALAPVPHMQFLDPNGKPLAGGKVCTYNAGTTTQAPTYVDTGGVILNSNPIVLDSGGFATIYLDAREYKFVVYDGSGNASCPNTGIQQWAQDNVSSFQILLQAQSIILVGTTVDPPGVAGQLGYRTDLGRVRFFNSAWDSLIGANTVDTLANKTLTNPVENSPLETTPTINGVPMAGGPGAYQLYPNTGTGTTINLLVKLSSAPSGAIVPAITDTGGVVGICVGGCGAAGTAQVQESGGASCVVDNASVSGDYLQISTTVAGNCHDAGASYPGSGQVIGRVLATAAAGLQPISLFGPEVNPKASQANLALLTIANAAITGTTLNQLVKLTGAPSTAVATGISDTSGAIGICTANCGTGGSATVQLSGPVSCIFDATGTTAGDYVIISSATAGNCRDGGATYPNGKQVIGRVLTTNVGNGTYAIDLFPSEITPPPTFFSAVRTATGGGCTTQGTSFSNCDVTLTWSGGGFADTSYIPTCSLKDTNMQASGGDGSSGDVPSLPIRSFTATQIVATVQTLAARVITNTNVTVYCIGVHP